MNNPRLRAAMLGAVFFGVLAFLCVHVPTPRMEASAVPKYWVGPVVDTPSITIAAATATSTATPTTGAKEAHIVWTFGTVAGSYGTCTVQAQTTYDGTTFLTLGSAQSVTATSTTVNAWDIYEQAPTTSVTNTSTSATAATGFGQQTQFKFSCSSYGTSAPVTITGIYK